MRVGLCGAQRVGKTTLAKAAAEKYKVPFVATATRSVFARLGKDPKAQYPIQERIEIQEAILDTLRQQWLDTEFAIFDRTPFDVLAYFEADVLRDFPSNPEIVDRYMRYRNQCLQDVRLFDAILLVQPGIPIIEDAEAAPGSLPYMEHFNTLCLGYQAQTQEFLHTLTLPREILAMDQRVHYLGQIIDQVLDERADRS